MSRLPPIRLWRNLSLALFGVGLCAALAGTVLVQGQLAIHFDSSGAPNGFAGKWVLWLLLAMAFFSLFTSAGFSKKSALGQFSLSLETGCALSAWLVTVFSLADVLLVACHLFPYAAVQAVGFAFLVGALPLFLLISFLRNRRGGQPGPNVRA